MVQVGLSVCKTGDQLLTLEFLNKSFVKIHNICLIQIIVRYVVN